MPVPNTIAFGGVPTGIMKANDVPIVAAMRSPSGSSDRDEAAADTNGIIVAASAVLDVTSLAIVAMKVTPAVIPHSGKPDNDNAHAPTTSAAPVL